MKTNKLFHKWISFCLAVTLTSSLFPARNVLAEETTAETPQESISQDQEILWETIQIDSTEDFLSFAESCSLDSWSANKQVLLNTDISLLPP